MRRILSLSAGFLLLAATALGYGPQGTTTDGTTWQTLGGTTFDIGEDSVCFGRYLISATDHGGDVAVWQVGAHAYRVGSGSVQVLGLQILNSQKTLGAAAWSIRLDAVDSDTVHLQVRGAVMTTVDWGYVPGDSSGWDCMQGAT